MGRTPSSSKPARSPARLTARCSRPTARPPCCAPRSPSKSAKPGQDFFPLTVNYQEKTFAAGKIPGGFFKREGRPSEKETLVSRLIDRPIRPLFARGSAMRRRSSARSYARSRERSRHRRADRRSAALTISGIPFLGPIGGARVGYIDGQYVLNPPLDELAAFASSTSWSPARTRAC